MHLYIFSHVYKLCLKCRGRVVINVVRTFDPTPLLYEIWQLNMPKMKKICFAFLLKIRLRDIYALNIQVFYIKEYP